MSWINNGVIGKVQELLEQPVHHLFHRSSPQIGSANASGKQRVACKKLRRCDNHLSGIRRQKETRTAWRMARRVNHLRLQIAPLQFVAFTQKLVNFHQWWRLNAKK